VSKSREQLICYLQGIDIAGCNVLDIGVQDNPASNYTHGRPKQYDTVDIDTQWNPTYELDLNDDWKALDIGKYDVVFCLETLEHIWNPIQAIQNIAGVLEGSGTVYLSTPFINPIHDKWDYLRYTVQWFTRVLPRHGFKEVKVQARVATWGKQELDVFYKAEGMRMSKVTYEMGYGGHYYDVGYFVTAKR